MLMLDAAPKGLWPAFLIFFCRFWDPGLVPKPSPGLEVQFPIKNVRFGFVFAELRSFPWFLKSFACFACCWTCFACFCACFACFETLIFLILDPKRQFFDYFLAVFLYIWPLARPNIAEKGWPLLEKAKLSSRDQVGLISLISECSDSVVLAVVALTSSQHQ